MSRKFYEKLARTFNECGASDSVIYSVALLLEAENPRFKRDKFLEASGYKGGS